MRTIKRTTFKANLKPPTVTSNMSIALPLQLLQDFYRTKKLTQKRIIVWFIKGVRGILSTVLTWTVVTEEDFIVSFDAAFRHLFENNCLVWCADFFFNLGLVLLVTSGNIHNELTKIDFCRLSSHFYSPLGKRLPTYGLFHFHSHFDFNKTFSYGAGGINLI